MFEVRLLASALDDLKRLDKPVARRVLARLDWLVANFEAISPETLTGDLAGLHKFRIGDYRVIYQLLTEENVLLVHAVGHRRDVYRRKP